MGDSSEACRWSAEVKRKGRSSTSPSPEGSMNAAKAAVTAKGGSVNNRQHVLGQMMMTFGAYQGKSFLWVLENSLGWAAYLVDDMEKRREKEHGVPLSNTKFLFREYLLLFSEGAQALQLKRARQQRSGSSLSAAVTVPATPSTSSSSTSHQPEESEIFMISSEEDEKLVQAANIIESSHKLTSASTSEVTTSAPLTLTSALISSAEASASTSEVTTSAPLTLTSALISSAEASASTSEVTTSAPLTLTSALISSAETSASTSEVTTSAPLTLTSALISSAEERFPLPEGWRQSLPEEDRHWISKALFKWSGQGKPELDIGRVDKLWWHPPQPSLSCPQAPRPDRYFATRLFLWMPLKLWHCRLKCPHDACAGHALTQSGIYHHVRQVVDVDGFYNLAGEYLECLSCKKKFISWSSCILKQLDIGHRLQFPAILTYHHACDIRVIRMLRQRGLGNGPMQLYKKLREQHSEAWLRQTALYLTDMEPFCTAAAQRLVTVVNPKEPPQPSTLPQLKWIQSVYIMDTLQRLPEVKATITSTFGAILKLDSTKKIVKKLTGRASGTAAWMTNLGNEHGQVLISVLTTHEGGGLEPMLRGIIERYSAAEVSPPSLLYVDRDCCSSRTKGFFTSSWPELEVRLDIWHFMRRIASGVTTDSHQLYRSFMGGLSQAIFEWEKVDLDCLKMAKEQAMKCEGIPNPSEADVMRRISRRELALHCRRSTRGVQETTRLIQALLLAYSGPHGNDTLGVPLLDSVRIWGIWQDQQRHLSCLQDPPGIQLYRQTGTLTKGGLQLPVYRCARGSTSLESFHLHLNRFIPGNSANDVHYQAYLLEGLVRWNQDRAAAALPSSQEPWCYSGQIRHGVNQLANKVLKHSINPSYTLPRKYTGELIGVEYLYQQTSAQLDVDTVIVDMETSSVETPPVCEDDEGFDEDQTGTDDWTVASVNNVLAELCDGNAELTAVRSPIMQSSVTGRSAPPALHDLSRLSAAGLASPRSHATRTPASRSSQPPSASASFTSVDASSETKSASSQSPCQPLVMQPPVEDPPSTHIPATRTGVSRKSRSKGPPALISALPVSVLPSRPVTVTASVSTVKQPAHSTSSSQPPFASLSMSSVHTASNDEDSVGPDNIPGYGRVQQLADFLVSHRDQQCLTTTAAASVVELYNRLSAYDKQQTVFPPRHKPTLDKGRFKRPKSRCAVVPGAESVQRCMLGSNEGPATRPGANRVMESLVWRLCELHPADVTVKGKRTSRWHLILSSYSHIRNLLANNAVVMRETQLQLGHINQKTLSEWVNKQATNKDRLMLEQGLRLSPPPMTSTTPLPSANPQPTTLDTGSEGERHHFDLPESTAGQAKVRHRRKQQKQLATSENPVQIACAPQHSGPVCLLVPQADPNAPPMVLALPPAFLPQYAPATSTPIPPALFTPPSGLQQTHSQPLSKTQEWRNKKRQGLDLHGQATERKRKVFDCKRCGKERSSSNHKQFYGKWWCSEKSGMPYDAWLVEQKQSRTERKKDK